MQQSIRTRLGSFCGPAAVAIHSNKSAVVKATWKIVILWLLAWWHRLHLFDVMRGLHGVFRKRLCFRVFVE